MNVKNYIK